MATRQRRKPKASVDPYKVVTDQIIEALEGGVVPWHRPWKRLGGPMRLSAHKPYRGVNVFILELTAALRGYESRWWGTYRQINKLGGQVRRKEKGTTVVLYKHVPKKVEGERRGGAKVPDDEREFIRLLRYFTVFNTDQADGIEAPPETELLDLEPIDECEQISADYRRRGGPRLRHGGDWAFYDQVSDSVQLPKLGQFDDAEHYYGAMFHEYGHSTGAPKRLDRAGFVSGRFGDPDYSNEELVAEMCAAFVCSQAGIDVNVPHRASYLDNWLHRLNNDRKLIVHAASQGQAASDLILGIEPEKEAEDGDD